MKYGMYSVYDSKAGAFLPPFVLPRTQQAQRVFGDCVNSPDHQFGKHPDDYTLFHLGNWDDETGDYKALPASKQSLGNGVEYVDLTHQSADPEGKTNGSQIPLDASIQSGSEG